MFRRHVSSSVWVLAFVFSVLFVVSISAEVRLPSVFGSAMVLQRDMPIPVWGWAEPNEDVTVKFCGKTYPVRTSDDGKWRVELDAQPVGPVGKMIVQGTNRLILEDILMGDVWVCSGQSNMGFVVKNAVNSEAEIAAADYPDIRLLKVPLKGTQEPQEDFSAEWKRCSPDTIGTFSAVGYFFGRDLYRSLDVPVGLINCAWGGSACDAWIDRKLMEKTEFCAPIIDRWTKVESNWTQEGYEKKLAAWKEKAAAAREAGRRPPRRPRNQMTGQHRPGNLYNGMLKPLIGLAIRGAIWYQGESNSGRAYQYRELFPLMIRNWRAAWGQGDFPFLWVQLANFRARSDEPSESNWAELREAQTMTLKLPNTGQAVIIDVGAADDIHPKDKQTVGRRLCLAARKVVYEEDIVFSGPVFESMEITGSEMRLDFEHVGEGLTARGGGQLKGFAVAGSDRQFSWADARIEGDSVVVRSDSVSDPVAVRYAWADNPECNLYNTAGLPACPFRTDTWPGITAESR